MDTVYATHLNYSPGDHTFAGGLLLKYLYTELQSYLYLVNSSVGGQ